MIGRIFKKKKNRHPVYSFNTSITITSINQLVPVYQAFAFVLSFVFLVTFKWHSVSLVKEGFVLGAAITSIAFSLIYAIHNYSSNKPIVTQSTSTPSKELLEQYSKKIGKIATMPSQLGYEEKLFYAASDEDKRFMLEAKKINIIEVFNAYGVPATDAQLMAVIYINALGNMDTFLANADYELLAN